MPVILPVKGKFPVIDESCFIAENATVVGDVVLGEGCSVWFTAVIRGDVNFIHIGKNTNVQDGAVIHCTYEKAGTSIGNNVSIGHRAIVHGCTIRDNSLVGMGAIVMDHADVHENCIIAAGALVLENMICEEGHIYAGVPARKIKKLSSRQITNLQETARNYVMYSGWFNDPKNEDC